MELAGLNIIMDADFSAVASAISQITSLAANFASTIKNAFNGIPDFKNKFNFTSNGASQAAQDAREYARAAREQAAADLDAAKAKIALDREADRQSNKNKNLKDEYGQLVAANQALVREYYNAAASIIKYGDASGITAAQLEEMRVKAKAGQDQLASIEQGAGRFQRQVGNYAKGFNPLNHSLSQITREFPAFKNSIQTGFMAISNNIGPFFDALKDIRIAQKKATADAEAAALAKSQQAEASALAAGMTKSEAKEAGKLAAIMTYANPEQIKAALAARLVAENAAKAAGMTELQAKAAGDLAAAQALANVQQQKAPGAFKALLGALVSWQTALSVGITLLTFYGPKIAEWMRGVLAGSEAAKKAADAQKLYAESTKKATEEGEKNAAKEITNAEVLYRSATNLAASTDIRRQSAKKLIELYPEIFKGLNQESILAGKAADAYRILTAALKDKIALEVGEEQLKALFLEREATEKNYKNIRTATGIYEDFKKAQAEVHQQFKEGKLVGDAYDKKISEITAKYNAAQVAFEKGTGEDFPKITRKGQIAIIDATTSALARYEQKVQEVSAIRGKMDSIFPDTKKDKAVKDVRTAGNALEELAKKNTLVDKQFEFGLITFQQSLEEQLTNWESYVKDISGRKLKVGLDDPMIKEALSAMEKLTGQLQLTKDLSKQISITSFEKLPVIVGQFGALPVALRDAAKAMGDFGLGSQVLEDVANNLDKVGGAAIITKDRFDTAMKAAVDAIKKARIGEATFELFAKVRDIVKDSITNTAEIIGEGIGRIIAGTGGIKELFSGIGQMIGDQIIDLGKALIKAGFQMTLIWKAIEALSSAGPIGAVIAIGAGIAAVAAGTLIKESLSKNANSGRRAFAAGGIVSGPTNALVGEYAGARNNPEVIAPLNKLPGLLKQAGIGQGGQQVFIPSMTIKGQDIVIAFERTKRSNNR